MFKSVRKKSVRDQNAPESAESYYFVDVEIFVWNFQHHNMRFGGLVKRQNSE